MSDAAKPGPIWHIPPGFSHTVYRAPWSSTFQSGETCVKQAGIVLCSVVINTLGPCPSRVTIYFDIARWQYMMEITEHLNVQRLELGANTAQLRRIYGAFEGAISAIGGQFVVARGIRFHFNEVCQIRHLIGQVLWEGQAAMTAPFSTPRRELASQSFDQIERYWSDPAFAAEADAEGKRLNDASMAALDAGIAKYRANKEQSDV